MSLPPLPVVQVPSVARVRARARRNALPSEHAVQVGFIQGCRLLEKQYPDLSLLFAVPNGGYRSGKTAALLQQEGVRPGIPDVLLPVARGGHIGMAIEFKKPGEGRLSDAQKEYMVKLARAGWRVVVHTDPGDALADILLYLRG